ncbi:MAG TPA: dienelactone hydrolase family protein [Candidatus Dormibacteraeota bacterium]|nr:dienelactone hydrolase family protein [Candidatus Dormibacteraeota bacterium]
MCHPEVPEGMQAPEVQRLEVDVTTSKGAMPAFLARPERGEGPGVLVIHDVYGRTAFYEELAVRLAVAGFQALLPDLFFRLEPLREQTLEVARERLARLDEVQAMSDLQRAIGFLQRQPGGAGRTGTLGFCLGGTYVLNLAGYRDDLVSVCYYGFPARYRRTDLVFPLEMVDEIHGPILGLWGEEDTGVGIDNVRTLAARLAERGVEFECVIYPGVGHAFLRLSGLRPENPGYEVACDSWRRTLDFYRRHLTLRPAIA